MENTELHVGFCPNCHNEIRVPNKLAKFSCMYCGTKLTHDDLTSKTYAENKISGDFVPWEFAYENLPKCILNNLDIASDFSNVGYEPSFLSFKEQCLPSLESLNDAVLNEPSSKEELLAKMSEHVLDCLYESMTQDKKWTSKLNRDIVIDKYKFVIAVYFIPMVNSLKLAISHDFCVIFRECWIKRFPKSTFEIGDFDVIQSGFKKRFLGLCFITTAVCEDSGKPDDCYELTTLREFRDNYLMSCPDGPALIDEYYDIAPVIVNCINICDNKKERYEELRTKYIDKCLDDIEAGNLEECKNRYIDMVNYLKNKYLPA